MLNTVDGDIIVGQHLHIIFKVLPDLFDLFVFQQWLNLLQYLRAIKLLRCAGIIMCEWNISCLARLDSKRQAHNLSLHGIQIRGLGIKSKQSFLLDPV